MTKPPVEGGAPIKPEVARKALDAFARLLHSNQEPNQIMQLRHKLALLFFAPVIVASMSSAATVIIDGTAPGYTNNGSFETTTGWQGNETTVTNLGTSLGITRNVQYRTASGTPTDGTTYAVIGQNTASATGVMGIFLNTGYNLVLGDKFNLNFWHGNHSAVSSGLSINWQLFTSTTGTDTGVVQDVIASGFVSGSATNVQVIQAGIGSVTGASAGERLFLSFTPSGSNGQFALLDEINLTVIPEPSSLTLLGLSCLLILSRRRS